MLRLRRVQTSVSVVSNGRADEVSWALGVREAPGSFVSSSSETQATDHSAVRTSGARFLFGRDIISAAFFEYHPRAAPAIHWTPGTGRNSLTILPDSQRKARTSH